MIVSSKPFQSFRIGMFILLLFFSFNSNAGTPNIFEKQKRDHATISAVMETCSQDTAIAISFDDVFDPRPGKFQANPEYFYQCVKFGAIARWRRIVRDRLYSYRIAQSGIFRADESMKIHIGLVGHETMKSAGLSQTAISGTITGVLATCGFTMGGYCHYESGPYLVMESVRGQKITSSTRYLGEWAHKELGNLTEIDEAKAAEFGIYSYFDKWIEAITTGDQKSFEWIASKAGYGDIEHAKYTTHRNAQSRQDLHGYYRGLWEAFFDPGSPYTQIDRWNGERKYFSVKTSISDKPGYMACVCIIDNCTGRWPISSADQFVNKHVPYICIRPNKGETGWETYLPAQSSGYPVFEKQYLAPK